MSIEKIILEPPSANNNLSSLLKSFSNSIIAPLAECCILSSKGALIEIDKDLHRDDNLLFAEGGSRIIFSINKTKQNEWLNYLKQKQINWPSSVYVKKIGYVSSDTLKIKINEKNICNIRVEELTEKFNNSISVYF